MLPIRYVELCSQYRNRHDFPNPSTFIVDVNTTLDTNKSIDADCNTSPILYWNDSFNETNQLNYVDISQIDISYSTTDNSIVEVIAPNNTLRALDKFYNGTVLSLNIGLESIPYITDGLILNLDARNPNSYPGTGSYWYDISGNLNHATLQNNPTFINDRMGFFFNYTNYAVIPNSTSLNPIQLTMEAYVYTRKLNSTSEYQQILSKYTQYSLTQNTTNVLTATINDDGILNNLTGVPVEENTWYHLVGTCDILGNVKVYVNDRLVYTGSVTPPINVTFDPLYIANLFGGNILVVRMYNRELNATEINQNYNNIVQSQDLYLRRRIKNYTYLSTDKAELVLYPPPLPDRINIISGVIEKPIYNTQTDTVPRFFIPQGENISNFYVNYYLQNLDLGESRKIISYDGITHLATLDENTESSWLVPYTWVWEGGPSLVNIITPNTPNPRYNSQTWVDSQNRVWIYGGVIYDPSILSPNPPLGSDFWQLYGNTNWLSIDAGSGYDALPSYVSPFTPGSRANALTWVDLNDRFWLHGGEAPQLTGIYADTWMYDGVTWNFMGGNTGLNIVANYGSINIPATTNSPGSRSNAITWFAEGALWLYGGMNVGNRKSDFWRFRQEADGNYYWTWVGGSNGNNLPSVYVTDPGCRGYNTAFWYSNNKLWIYGGDGTVDGINFGYLHDLWSWDGSTWTYIFGTQTLYVPANYGIKDVYLPSNTPGTIAMVGTYRWVDSNGNLWLFGGATDTLFPNYPVGAIWCFNTTLNQWVWIQGPSIYVTNPTLGVYTQYPGARNSGVSWSDVYGNFWLYGGQGYGEILDNPSYILSDIWKFNLINSNFTIRKQIPQYGRVLDAINYLIQIQENMPTTLYKNAFIRIIGNKPNTTLGFSINPAPYAESRAIYNYIQNTGIAEVRQLFTASPIGLSYELLPFTVDNYQPLIYPYDKEGNTIYDVRLVSLRVPHLTLTTGYGGTVLDYPFLYVTIQNFRTGSGGSNTLVFSNNPNATNTTFCVSTSDTSYIEGAFIDITYTEMTQRIQINPKNKLLVKVTLPNGELLSFIEPENMSPTTPNPNIQISFLFEFKKL